MEREDHSSIDIEDPDTPLVRSIRKLIDDLPPLSPDQCCIFRVPKNLRNVNEKAYTPQIVSIGPLHHGEKDLQAMEELKLRYLHAFLERTKMNLEKCVKEIKVWEQTARNFYSESIKLSSDEFVKMILVDSGFIIEVFLRYDSPAWKLPEMIDVVSDMILIENQLPFFVFENLYKLAFASHQQDMRSFVVLSIKYFMDFLPLNYIPEMISSSEVKHFVDLIRMCLLPASRSSSQAPNGVYISIRNATELHNAGVKFMKRSSNCLMDMQFTGGSLEIPHLLVLDITESMLRNLIALELYCYRFDSYIIDYVCFMDNLIDTPKDVDLLIQNEIIENGLGDNFEVAALFNKLTTETTIWDSNFYFSGLSGDLDAYCKIPWHNWKAILKRDYFSTPFRGASTVAAVILLVLTSAQTICSILSL